MWWLKCSVILVTVISVSAAPTPFADELSELRLPGTSVPSSYELSLTTNVHRGLLAYTGNVKIRITITAATNIITLHNSGLVISQVILSDEFGAEIANTYATDSDKSFLNVQVESELAAESELTLDINFSGNLKTGTAGFYRSSYVVDGTTRYYKSL